MDSYDMSDAEIGLRPTRAIVAKIKNIIWRLVNPQYIQTTKTLLRILGRERETRPGKTNHRYRR